MKKFGIARIGDVDVHGCACSLLGSRLIDRRGGHIQDGQIVDARNIPLSARGRVAPNERKGGSLRIGLFGWSSRRQCRSLLLCLMS